MQIASVVGGVGYDALQVATSHVVLIVDPIWTLSVGTVLRYQRPWPPGVTDLDPGCSIHVV